MFSFLGTLIKRTIQIVAGLCILFVAMVFFYNPADTNTVSKTSTTVEKKIEEPKVEVAKVEVKELPKVKTVDDKIREAKGSLSYMCTNAVKAAAKYPSKVDPDWGADVKVFKNFSGTNQHRFLITRTGDMMNGFGNMIPYKAVCKLDWNSTTDKTKVIEFWLNNQLLVG